jgi:hypothetical protein
MSNRQREIYHSENGDRWLLCRDDDGRAFVLHKANASIVTGMRPPPRSREVHLRYSLA